MKAKLFLTLLAVFALCLPASAAVVSSTANMYCDFEGPDAWNTYTSDTAWGGGWTSWDRASDPAVYVAQREVGVTSYDAMDGTGFMQARAYLLSTAPPETEVVRGAVSRLYSQTTEEGFNANAPHDISFSIRIEDRAPMFDNFFDNSVDRVQIFGGANNTTSPSGNFTFTVRACLYGENTTPTWVLLDAGRGTEDPNAYIDTGIPVIGGDIYDIAVHMNPATYGYHVDIYNRETEASYTSTTDTGLADADLGWYGTTNNGRITFGQQVNRVGPGGTMDLNYGPYLAVDNMLVAQDMSFNQMSQVVARFDDGPTETAADGYKGMAGNGWAGAWQVNTYLNSDPGTSLPDLTTVVTSSDTGYQELKTGSGNYLSVTLDSSTAPSIPDTDYARIGVSRNYKANAAMTEAIDYTQDHQIEFTVRIDELDINSPYFDLLDNYNDRYLITGSSTDHAGTSTLDSFFIMATGADKITEEYPEGQWGGATVKQWAFGVGDQNDNIDHFIASGIDLVTGGVYDFTITMHPDDQTYDITLTDGTTTVTEEDLLWRTSATEVGGWLNFSAFSSTSSDQRAFSLDDIVITGIVDDDLIPGDANEDGFVDGSDATILANYWQHGVGMTNPDATWAMGDFNGDHIVDGSDATLLASHWQEGTPPSSAVPEPSTIILLFGILAGLGLIRRRR